MPTIKDIARAAGVSQGTVSNVLNNRGNVSVEKINLVKKTARDLGYQTNEKARLLREGTSRSVAVILPDIKIPCYAGLYSELQEYITKRGYTVSLYQPRDIPAVEISVVKQLEASIVDGIIAVTCLSEDFEVYGSPFLKNTKKIFALRRPSVDCAYVGFDFFQAGAEIGNYVSQKGYRTAAFFSGPGSYSNEAEFLEGFQKSSAVKLHHMTAEYIEINKKAFIIPALSPYPECIIAANTVYAAAVKTAYYYSGIENIPEMIVLSPAGIQKGSSTTDYQLDFQRLGKELGQAFFSPEKPSQKIVKNTGFSQSVPWVAPNVPAEEINLLTIHSPAAEALRKILPLFQRESGIQVNLHAFSYDETFRTIQAFGSSGTYDLLRLDMAWGPWLAPEYLTPLSEVSGYSEELFGHVVPELLADYCTFDDKLFAFPLDPSVQLLFYRKDLFEDAAVQRGYYEKYKEKLKVPQTFEELNRTARYFSRNYVPESPIDYGMTMVAGNAGMASCEMIPRMLALEDGTKPVILNGPSGLAALENYLECSNYCKNPQAAWWKEAAEEFASGSTAMTILFANHASEILGSPSTKTAGKVGFAPVPGGRPLLGGGILGIAKGSARKEASMKFFKWFARDDIALMFAMLGGTSGNPAVFENMEILRRYPWMREVRKSLAIGVGRKDWLRFGRPVEERRIEETLGIAVQNALAGTVSAKKALDYAQDSIERLL